MKRLTSKGEMDRYLVEENQIVPEAGAWGGEAVDRLGRFEDAYAYVVEGQEKVLEELERLRAAGKKNSVQFREMLGKKMVNNAILSTFRVHGLE